MKKTKIYILAGEPSGDLLASRLMNAMNKAYPNQIEFKGVGGDTMAECGLKSLFDISDISIMGVFEIIPSLPKVLKRMAQTVKDIIDFKPDLLLTVDSWSFSARIHKAIKRKKLPILQAHYVAPQVWAWKKKRAKTMYKYIDLLLTLLPYEPKYFTPYKLKTLFVGHPVIESKAVNAKAEDFFEKFNVSKDKTVVSILPGSRHTEVCRLLPDFINAAKKLYENDKNLHFVVPTVKTVASRVKNMLKEEKLPYTITYTETDRYNAFKASKAAMAASGTVALELAILEVPHIIAYKVSPLSALLAKKLLHINFVNLSNILLSREVVPELLQEKCTPEQIVYYMQDFLSDGERCKSQKNEFSQVKKVLGFGVQNPSQKAAEILWDFVNKNETKD